MVIIFVSGRGLFISKEMATLSVNQTINWLELPLTAGVYQFLDNQRKPVYIGKAVNIRQRVKQHFQDKLHPKEKLIRKATRFIKFNLTNSGLSALLLEANLIRRFQPKYNAVLLDDKSRLYIVVTKAVYPKVGLIRQRDLDLYGPFLQVLGPLSSVGLARQLLKKIRQVIPFCTEKTLSPKPCFYSQINLCSPCPNFIEQQNKDCKTQLKKQYLTNIKRLLKLLQGHGNYLLDEFETEFKNLAKNHRYEEAAVVRDRWYYLQALFARQLKEEEIMLEVGDWREQRKQQLQSLKRLLKLPKLQKIECYDISNFNFKEATASMVVFVNAQPKPKQYRRFKIKGRTRFDPEMLAEVLLRRSKHSEWPKADLIVIDGGRPQLRGLHEALPKSLSLPMLVGLAKRPDRLVLLSENRDISLIEEPKALTLLQAVRDEAHRFAKKYHLYLRQQTLLKMLTRVK